MIDQGTRSRGQWRKAAPCELKSCEKLGTTILLIKVESDKSWLLSRRVVASPDGHHRMLIDRTDLGLSYRGNRVGGR